MIQGDLETLRDGPFNLYFAEVYIKLLSKLKRAEQCVHCRLHAVAFLAFNSLNGYCICSHIMSIL